MALLLRRIFEGYKFINDEISDPRTANFWFIGTPFPGLAILGLYLYFVLKWGPNWMKDRKPFNLEKVMLVYNAGQVIACVYLLIKSIQHAWGWKYKWLCEPVDWHSDHGLLIAGYVHFYFILKIVDLLDTVFFVLRKKNNQITFLHVYHHTGMVMLTWGAVKYLPGGHGTLLGVINSFVHAVMYFYYLLTIADPSYKKSIWWKKYITQLQIVQFLILVLHFVALVLSGPSCEYPRWVSAVFLPQNLFMLILFLDFYRKAYMGKPKQRFAAKTISSNGSNETHSDVNDNLVKNVIKCNSNGSCANGSSIKVE